MVGPETVTKILNEITDYRLRQYFANLAPMYRTGELSLNQISRIFGIDEQKCLDLIEESESAGNQS